MMIGFCGALDVEKRAVGFSTLKKMCGLHSSGCAFVNHEFGILCDGVGAFSDETLQPVTVSYNNALYTAAIVASIGEPRDTGTTARAVLEGYFEEGEDFIHRLDFPYALALYDGRCGELLLAKGKKGDKALFYTRRDGVLYFASALRPLIRLYGGCVRINTEVLRSHILSGYGAYPDGLFCDIHSLHTGHSLLCSRLGESDIPALPCVYPKQEKNSEYGDVPFISKSFNMRKALTDALFAFDYPQFDCLMPALLSHVADAAANGIYSLSLSDGMLSLNTAYATERAERISALYNVEINSTYSDLELPTTRILKQMDKELDTILSTYLDTSTTILHRIITTDLIDTVNTQKNLPLRIRSKALLSQTAMWFESYNLVLR